MKAFLVLSLMLMSSFAQASLQVHGMLQKEGSDEQLRVVAVDNPVDVNDPDVQLQYLSEGKVLNVGQPAKLSEMKNAFGSRTSRWSSKLSFKLVPAIYVGKSAEEIAQRRGSAESKFNNTRMLVVGGEVVANPTREISEKQFKRLKERALSAGARADLEEESKEESKSDASN